MRLLMKVKARMRVRRILMAGKARRREDAQFSRLIFKFGSESNLVCFEHIHRKLLKNHFFWASLSFYVNQFV